MKSKRDWVNVLALDGGADDEPSCKHRALALGGLLIANSAASD
jgi:hypothetical protein